MSREKMKEVPKYKYTLHTWGGFYNDDVVGHDFKEGGYSFNTKVERDTRVDILQKKAKELNQIVCINKDEGYTTDQHTTLHRISSYKGKEVYTTCVIDSIYYPMDSALFYIGNSWYPGHNDYPFGDDFDYTNFEENPDFIVKAEWITGAFRHINNDEFVEE